MLEMVRVLTVLFYGVCATYALESVLNKTLDWFVAKQLNANTRVLFALLLWLSALVISVIPLFVLIALVWGYV